MPGPPSTVAVLVSPLENLVGVDSVLSCYSCDRRTGNKCRLYDAPLLLRRTKNPLRRIRRGNLTRITHEPIVQPILKSVYTVRAGRLQFKRLLKALYSLRSKAIHRAEFNLVGNFDLEEFSHWIAWMIISMASLGERGYRTLSAVKEQILRLDAISTNAAASE